MRGNEVILIMEYADGGELLDYVEDKKGLEELEARNIIKQLVLGIENCHD